MDFFCNYLQKAIHEILLKGSGTPSSILGLSATAVKQFQNNFKTIMENKDQAKNGPGNEVMAMFKKIQELKLRVEKSEKPCWQTNRMFRYSDSSAHGATDIGTVTDPRKLIEMLAFLKDRESSYNSAAAELGLESKTFKWLNFTVDEWKSDFSTRVEQLRVSESYQIYSEI
jgi:hypothetical protein